MMIMIDVDGSSENAGLENDGRIYRAGICWTGSVCYSTKDSKMRIAVRNIK